MYLFIISNSQVIAIKSQKKKKKNLEIGLSHNIFLQDNMLFRILKSNGIDIRTYYGHCRFESSSEPNEKSALRAELKMSTHSSALFILCVVSEAASWLSGFCHILNTNGKGKQTQQKEARSIIWNYFESSQEAGKLLLKTWYCIVQTDL